MKSVPFGSLDTDTIVTCIGRERSTVRLQDCEEVSDIVTWVGDNQVLPNWCAVRPWRALALGTLDGGDKEPGPNLNVGVDYMRTCLSVVLEYKPHASLLIDCNGCFSICVWLCFSCFLLSLSNRYSGYQYYWGGPRKQVLYGSLGAICPRARKYASSCTGSRGAVT